MRKRLTVGLLSAGLLAAMLPGIATAAPNPDSAAGICGSADDANVGIGDTFALRLIPGVKSEAEAEGIPLGRAIKSVFEQAGPAWGLPEGCAQADLD